VVAVLACAGHADAASLVELRSQILLASNQPGSSSDPRVAHLVAQLRTALPYASFQLLGAPGGKVALGQLWKTELPGGQVAGGRILELTPTAIDRGAVQVQARVIETKLVQGRPAPEAIVNTSLRLQRGATVVIGGPAYQNGVLVIVISAWTP
jgi:hypothetical protein